MTMMRLSSDIFVDHDDDEAFKRYICRYDDDAFKQ
jgi:hypothetical protein